MTILLVLAMLATLGILFAGLIGFVRGRNTRQQSNMLMRWRVFAQAGTLVVFALLLLLLRH